jgi:hypothetical protein
VSSHFKGYPIANCRKSTNRWTNILPLSDIFKQKSCIIKKSKVTDGSSNQKRAYKSDEIILSKCISSLSFQGTTMIHDINRTEREQILGFGLRITKKQYFALPKKSPQNENS